MSHALYRIGRFAARRPWTVIGVWMAVALLVIAASASFGRELEDALEAPGLDSTMALDLLTSAQSDAAGPTALVVTTPLESTETFFDSPKAVAALAELQQSVSQLPNVLSVSDSAGDLALLHPRQQPLSRPCLFCRFHDPSCGGIPRDRVPAVEHIQR